MNIKSTVILLAVLQIFLMPAVFAKDSTTTYGKKQHIIKGKPLVKIESEQDVKHESKDIKDSLNEKDYEEYMKKHGRDYREHYRANRQLKRRIQQLELAVMQLQDIVFELYDTVNYRSGHYNVSEKRHTCVLDTSYWGTYMGHGLSKIEAKANAKIACENKVDGYFCSESVKFTCDDH
ncbi:MAG: hypothetical protein HWE27_14185 [Gammaproteobacteria bacterium]|nr:hypothetical protein [Gammaproteobacteria bacterium]